MNTFIYCIGMLLIGVVCYFIGLRRGIIGTRHLYDEGWIDAEKYFKRFPELVQDIDTMLDDLSQEQENKYEKARNFVAQLDGLFDPECPIPEDENIVDGGTY